MANIAVLLPREYMKEQVEKIAAEEGLDLLMTRVINNSDALAAARNAISLGAQVVIARGLQAVMIREYATVPVVEIILTAQEIGLLVTRAKKQLGMDRPKIALIGFKNMICDMTHFNEIFDIDLITYYVEHAGDVEACVSQAVAQAPDMIIGGDMVEACMEQYNIPFMFFHSTEDCIRNALQIAKQVSYAVDTVSMNTAQFNALGETTSQGIIRIDNEHRITAMNKVAEQFLGSVKHHAEGKLIEEVLLGIEPSQIDSVLTGRRDIFSSTMRIHGQAYRYMIAPIQFDQTMSGALITLSTYTQLISGEQVQKSMLQGYVAATDFSMIKTTDKAMRRNITLARQYAASSYPVLIQDEPGYNKEIIAQCIHNNSSRRSMPFVAVNLSGLNDQEQLETLFGVFNGSSEERAGLAENSNYGTIFINQIENLSPFCQYQLYRLIRHQPILCGGDTKIKVFDVRVIAGTRTDLLLMVKNGSFRSDLYYAIAALSLNLVPIRQRPGDIMKLVEHNLKQFCKRNNVYLTISQEAMDTLCNFTWEGNEIQIENFLERLFISTTKREIRREYILKLLQELYPEVEEIDGHSTRVIYQSPEAAKIQQALNDCGGNRQLAAQKLGISTTTLWRHIKKYGLL